MRGYAIFLLGLLVMAARLAAQPIYVPGQTYFGANNYIEYQAGDLPIVITSPHGGYLTPANITFRTDSGVVYTNRTNGTYNGIAQTVTTDHDTNTQELARAIADEFYSRTGRRIHLVISLLRRTKLDPNREITEAALGNATAEQSWRDFHGFIQSSKDAVNAQYPFGFLIDIHGHGHEKQRLELGYSYNNELDLTDTQLNFPAYAFQGTLRTLNHRLPGVPYATLLRGPGSFGDLLSTMGNYSTAVKNFPACPSPADPAPGIDTTGDRIGLRSYFFNGGYIVRTHTSDTDNGPINGVQIETNYTGVRDNSTSRAAFATALVRTLQVYLFNNYGYELGAYSVTRITPPATTTLSRGGAALTVTATRTGNVALSSTVNLTFGGNAVLGTDFTASRTANFSYGSNGTTSSLVITPASTPNSDGDKIITLTLNPNPAQAASTTPLTIVLGDGLSQTVRVSAPTSISEGAKAVTFRFTRTLTTSALTVPIAWSGTASPESDYYDAPGSVVFAAGSATADITVSIVDDGRAEPDKTLVATIASSANYVVGIPGAATTTIVDDDRPANLAVWLRGDVANNVVPDSSGNNRHATSLPADDGTLSGPASSPVNGLPALAFDGTDDSVALPLFTPDPNSAFSIAFFFRLQTHATSAADQRIITYGLTRSDPGTVHIALSSSTNLRTYLSNRTTSTLDIGLTQDNVWRHYALTVGADGTARVYLNGILQKISTGTPFRLAANELFWLGWRPAEGTTSGNGNTTAFMRGGLRDFRVYQRVLGASEITALANNVQNYAAWLAQNNLPSALSSTSDADANGFPALVEYGLGARPAIADAPPRYTVTVENSKLTLRFLRETAATDLSWTVQASTDLGNWQTIATRSSTATQWTPQLAGVSVTETNGYVVVTDSVTADTQPSRFLRLRVDSQ